jgi:hypothetical protein
MRYKLCKENVKNYDEGNKLLNLKEVFDFNFAHRIKFSKKVEIFHNLNEFSFINLLVDN